MKIEFISFLGADTGGEVAAGGDDNKSKADPDVVGGAAADFVVPIVAPTRSKLLLEEIDGFLG